jgi:hypothetical protein
MRNASVILYLAAALAALPVASAHAQRMYKCVDAKGKVYYTQIPPKECQGQATQELSRQGRVVKEHEVITPEKQAAREAERKRKAEQEKLAGEERRKAAALLNTYSSEKDIEDARRRALKLAEDAIKASEKRITDAQKRRATYEKEKEFYAKTKLPEKLLQDIQNADLEIKNQQELMGLKKKEIGSINARYDDDRRRYVELTRASPVKR